MSLPALVLRRLLGAIPTLAVIVLLSFLLTRLAPGGPFDEEQALPPEIRAILLDNHLTPDLGKPRQLADIVAFLAGWFGSFRTLRHQLTVVRSRDFSLSMILG